MLHLISFGFFSKQYLLIFHLHKDVLLPEEDALEVDSFQCIVTSIMYYTKVA